MGKVKDKDKTRRQLLDELTEMRRRIADTRMPEARQRQMAEYIDIAGVIIVALDVDERITFLNRKGCDILGYKEEEVIGKNWFDVFVPARIRDEVRVLFKKLIAGEIEPIDYVEDSVLTRSGEERIIAWHNTLTRDEEGNISGVLDSGVDITERRRAEEALRENEERYRTLSVTDDLTGLYNRRHLYEVLEAELRRIELHGGYLSLTMLDIDGFKAYNDRHGHIAGDGVLKSFAQVLTSGIRMTDTAYRYGGDEFIIVLPATNARQARLTVDRVRPEWLRRTRSEYPGLETHLGISAGIVEAPRDAMITDDLLRLADAALYHSKREGGNRSALASETGQP